MDSAIHWMSLCPVAGLIGLPNTFIHIAIYPVDSAYLLEDTCHGRRQTSNISSLTVHKPLFRVGKLSWNKLMGRYYWSIRS